MTNDEKINDEKNTQFKNRSAMLYCGTALVGLAMLVAGALTRDRKIMDLPSEQRSTEQRFVRPKPIPILDHPVEGVYIGIDHTLYVDLYHSTEGECMTDLPPERVLLYDLGCDGNPEYLFNTDISSNGYTDISKLADTERKKVNNIATEVLSHFSEENKVTEPTGRAMLDLLIGIDLHEYKRRVTEHERREREQQGEDYTLPGEIKLRFD